MIYCFRCTDFFFLMIRRPPSSTRTDNLLPATTLCRSTISVSLLASWLVAVSLIPMLSARLKTPPAVQKSGGLIHKMPVRYARFLRWTLEHRGKSPLGIALIVAVSFVPVMHTKTNMFGGDRSEEHTSELQSLMRIS